MISHYGKITFTPNALLPLPNHSKIDTLILSHLLDYILWYIEELGSFTIRISYVLRIFYNNLFPYKVSVSVVSLYKQKV